MVSFHRLYLASIRQAHLLLKFPQRILIPRRNPSPSLSRDHTEKRGSPLLYHRTIQRHLLTTRFNRISQHSHLPPHHTYNLNCSLIHRYQSECPLRTASIILLRPHSNNRDFGVVRPWSTRTQTLDRHHTLGIRARPRLPPRMTVLDATVI